MRLERISRLKFKPSIVKITKHIRDKFQGTYEKRSKVIVLEKYQFLTFDSWKIHRKIVSEVIFEDELVPNLKELKVEI